MCVDLMALPDDLPVRVFPDYLAVPNLEEIAAPDADFFSSRTRAGEKPL
jgi:hypothetical protein